MQTQKDFLSSFNSSEEAISLLEALPGIGIWTTQYILMRALHDPDAFPASDAALRQIASPSTEKITDVNLLRIAEKWRPWRAVCSNVLMVKI